MMIKLTLDEKYRSLVFQITDIPVIEDGDLNGICKNEKENMEELARLWFGINNPTNIIKVVERIHSADEIEWIEPKYRWRLKSDKFWKRYIGIDILGGVLFFKQPDAANKMTESEFKKLLEDTGLPFETFEKVEADD